MKIKIRYWVFLCFIIHPLVTFGKPLLNIQHWTTDNGARVLFVQTHEIPMLDIQMTFDAGSARDGKEPGLSQFTNAMLNEGTKTLTADQIADEFEKVGAQFGTSVNRDLATVNLRTLTNPKLLDQAIQTFRVPFLEKKVSTKA